MVKKVIPLVLVALMMQAVCAKAAFATTKAQRVKAGISQLGTGPEARIGLKLRDRSELAGYVSRADEDSFVVTDHKTGAATTVHYANVSQVKGHNISKRANIAIGVGIVAFLVIAIIKWVNESE